MLNVPSGGKGNAYMSEMASIWPSATAMSIGNSDSSVIRVGRIEPKRRILVQKQLPSESTAVKPYPTKINYLPFPCWMVL